MARATELPLFHFRRSVVGLVSMWSTQTDISTNCHGSYETTPFDIPNKQLQYIPGNFEMTQGEDRFARVAACFDVLQYFQIFYQSNV